ncbi:olfactory receptor 10C1-like [Ranitomeya imitator]|uniref:olfactory receptor 10C1-like n=1 Tax=Ranitomeya imitator TaxID=111125 RepID=UPI0037E7D38A
MPFGLCKAPAVFKDFTNNIFRDMLSTSVVVYLYDILINSPDIDSHRRDVCRVFDNLLANSLYAREKNIHADALSCSIVSSEGEEEEPQLIVPTDSLKTVAPVLLESVPPGKTFVPSSLYPEVLSWAYSCRPVYISWFSESSAETTGSSSNDYEVNAILGLFSTPCLQEGMPSNITSIILLGFPNVHCPKFIFFPLLIIVYFGTIFGNLLIISLFSVSKALRSPMYFFITHLSLCDLLVITDVVPTLLHTILDGEVAVSFNSCVFQLCFFVTLESSECLLLSVMSYDRYLAICNPLRYNSIMNHRFCERLVNITWLIGFIMALTDVISIPNLYFCGPHVIDHFYCDLEPILQLSCSDTSRIHNQVLILGFFVVVGPFAIILMSYVCIAITILKIPSHSGRHKAFSTCSSHLIVVSLFYGTLITVYMFPTKGKFMTMSKALSLIYTVLTPLLNPIIYTLRNKDFKKVFHKLKLAF